MICVYRDHGIVRTGATAADPVMQRRLNSEEVRGRTKSGILILDEQPFDGCDCRGDLLDRGRSAAAHEGERPPVWIAEFCSRCTAGACPMLPNIEVFVY